MKRKSNKKIVLIYVAAIIIVIFGIFSTIFALLNSGNSNIINNIRINNIDVSGLNQVQAEEKIQNKISAIMNDKIVLKHREHEKEITLKQIEFTTNLKDKVYEACTIERNKNIIENNYKILNTIIKGENLDLTFKFNDKIVNSIYSNLDEEWEDKFVDNSYYIEDDKLIIVKGTAGVVINKEELQTKLNELIINKIQGKDINEIDIPTQTNEPELINIEKIREEIYKEAKDASYDKKTSTLQTHVEGVDFAITMDEAKEILQEDKDEYQIPLQITKPDITTDKLGEEAFPEQLSSFSTRYDASNVNRATNIELAVNAINGKVLLPGETFSFNGTVGPRTKAKGYLLAGAYSAGELVESYGGGVCQVSSTIYDSVLYANLEIVQRSNHSSVVSYVDPGLDATVSYGSKDFKFKNSRKYAIKIKAEAKNGILTVQIWGIPEEEEYEIELSSEVTEVIPCNTKYVYDSSLAPEQEIINAMGANGAKSIAYKTVKKNGTVISKTVISEDSYNPMTKVIKTGTRH